MVRKEQGILRTLPGGGIRRRDRSVRRAPEESFTIGAGGWKDIWVVHVGSRFFPQFR